MSDEMEALSPLPFVCPLCLWSWETEDGLRAHIPFTHNTTLDRYDAWDEESVNAVNYHVADNERLTAENAALRAALDEYADPENWWQADHVDGASTPFEGMRRKVWAWGDYRLPWTIARAALAGPASGGEGA